MILLKNDWEVKKIPYKTAKPFIEEYHYGGGSGNTGTAFGLFFKGDSSTLHGVSTWQPPIIGASKRAMPNSPHSVLSLSRFCLIDERPENAGSFLISKSISLLDNRWKMLVTFSDHAFKHSGGLYHASNWSEAGITAKRLVWWDPIKKCIVSRKSGPTTRSDQKMIDEGYVSLGKHAMNRFYYPIDRKNILVQGTLKFTKDGKQGA